MKLRTIFADLTHTGMGINADTFPYSVGLVAAYAKQELGDLIDISIHKFPDELSSELERKKPKILAMSSFVWNARLSYAFAVHTKKINPETVVIFGGPDFPTPSNERRKFLLEKSAIDFFIKWDGEYAFVHLIKQLVELELDFNSLKKERLKIPNVCYVDEVGEYVEGPDERLTDLMTVPSPYVMGLLDRFFETSLMPLVETTRGCPYGCTFCNDGNALRNNVYHKSVDFISEELEYIASRIKNTNQLHIADLNFGMYRHDVETAKIIRSVINKHDWPEQVRGAMGKSQPLRLLEVTNIINENKKGVIKLQSSLQSTDADVLKQIKRKNLSIEQLQFLRDDHQSKTNSTEEYYTELIVPLPGMTHEKHMNTLRDVIDKAEMNTIEVFQLILLQGSEMATRSERDRLAFQTRFRAYVGAFGEYAIGGNMTPIVEIEEVVVETDTMSLDEYLDCRLAYLFVKVLVDGDTYKEIFCLIKHLGLFSFDVIQLFQNKYIERYGPLRELAQYFKDLTIDKLYESYDDLEAMLSKAEILKKFKTGELGANEILACRVLAYREYREDINVALKEAVLDHIDSNGLLSEVIKDYIDEVMEFCQLRRFDFHDTRPERLRQDITRNFGFDFLAAEQHDFRVDPEDVRKETCVTFSYDASDLVYIDEQIDRWGTESLQQLGKFIQRTNLLRTRRKVCYRSPVPMPTSEESFGEVLH